MQKEKLISEAVKPLFETAVASVVVGEPVVPSGVVWRGTAYPVVRLLAVDKGIGACTHLSGEQYVRKHWYRFETTEEQVFRIYFERRARSGSQSKGRWWLYSVETPHGG